MKVRPHSPIARAILGTALAASLSLATASAATVWWEASGSTATNNWTDAGNWSSTAAGDGTSAGAIPGINDDLIFNTTGNNGTRTITMLGDRTARSLTFRNTGPTTFSSGSGTTATAMNIGEGGVTLQSGTGNVTFGNGSANGVTVRITASQTWTNNSTTGTLRTSNSLGSTSTAATILTFDGAGATTIGNTILAVAGSGALSIVKNGTGLLTLAGSSTSTYTGGTTINEGILAISSNNQLGNASGTLTFGGGTLRATNNVTSGRVITLNSGGGTIEVSTSGTTFAQQAAITGTGGLTKSGDGTLTLTSNISSYTGATVVEAGKLLVNGSLAGATGAVTVASGATLGGTGTIGGATTISGIHAPGNDAIGTQGFSSDLIYAAGSTFAWQIGAQSNSTTYDRVTVGGNLDISSTATFNIYMTGVNINDAFWSTAHTWDVFDANSTTGTFTAFNLYDSAAPTTPIFYGNRGSFSYVPSTGSLQWSIPEPTNALAGLLIAAGLLRRRRCAVA